MNNELILSEKLSTLLDEAITEYDVTITKSDLSKKSQRVFIASKLTIHDLQGMARLEGENYEEYIERRIIENLWTKMSLEGKYAWLSVDLQKESIDGVDMYVNKGGGTYRKDIHGILEHKRNVTEKMKARKVKKALSLIEEQLLKR
jgi:hypothetical protein